MEDTFIIGKHLNFLLCSDVSRWVFFVVLFYFSLSFFSFCLFVAGLFALSLLPFVSFHFILICVLIEPDGVFETDNN